jgi:hypothetical protein
MSLITFQRDVSAGASRPGALLYDIGSRHDKWRLT